MIDDSLYYCQQCNRKITKLAGKLQEESKFLNDEFESMLYHGNK